MTSEVGDLLTDTPLANDETTSEPKHKDHSKLPNDMATMKESPLSHLESHT